MPTVLAAFLSNLFYLLELAENLHNRYDAYQSNGDPLPKGTLLPSHWASRLYISGDLYLELSRRCSTAMEVFPYDPRINCWRLRIRRKRYNRCNYAASHTCCWL